MYIKSLIYEDQSTNWKLELIEFKSLTLLVGVSGVGKTQILKALLNLKRISRGRSLNGLKWEVEFKSSTGHDYKWCGAFENKGFISEIISEANSIGNRLIIFFCDSRLIDSKRIAISDA